MTSDQTLSHIRDILTRQLSSNRKTIVPKDILMVVVRGMEYYDLLMADQSGEFKKHSLLQLLQKAVSSLDIPDTTKDELQQYIQSPELSFIIDLIVTAAKGKFNIKRRRKWFKRVFGCCFNCEKNEADIMRFEQSMDAMIDIDEPSNHNSNE